MATRDEAFSQLWHAVKTTIPLNADAAIYQAWRGQYATWGSPISNEMPAQDEEPDAVYQCFTHSVVRWSSTRGVEVVTG